MKSIWKEMNSYGTVLRSEYISLKFNHMLETLQHLKFMIYDFMPQTAQILCNICI